MHAQFLLKEEVFLSLCFALTICDRKLSMTVGTFLHVKFVVCCLLFVFVCLFVCFFFYRETCYPILWANICLFR